MKTKHLLIVTGIFLVTIFYFLIGNKQHDSNFDLAQRDILIRKIGHEILLYSGDSTSRLLPAKKIGNEEYQLRFEKQFAFEPDSLVKIIRKSLAETNKSDYVVTVLECSGTAIVYGYMVSDHQKNEIIPCKGRNQPLGCYIVSIKFKKTNPEIKKYGVASLAAVLILLPLLILRYRKKKVLPAKIPKSEASIAIGTLFFDIEKKCLITSNGTINLTTKESKLLAIFAKKPNETIDRSRLQKEIWEDDGIIVGRSLDVFISKLRKKLESDPKVQLINVHSKGYKLLIDSPKI